MFGRNPQDESNFGYNNQEYGYSKDEPQITNYYSDSGPQSNTTSGPLFGENPGYDSNFGVDLTNQYGGGFLTSQANTTSVNQTSLGSHTFIQMKISMINRVWKENSMDNTFQILGLPLEHIKLVGHVTSIQRQGDNKYIIDLDDGTGLITCDFLVADTVSPYRQTQLNEILSGPNIYVKIYGAINTLGKRTPHIRAHIIRLIQNPLEIALHDLEVCYLASKRMTYLDEMEDFSTHIQNENTPYQSSNFNHDYKYTEQHQDNVETKNANPKTQGSTTQYPTYYPPNAPQAPPEINTKVLSHLIEAILSDSSVKSDPQGLHVHEILRKCQNDYNQSNVSEPIIRKALQDLENRAIVYTTINSDTFKISSS